jgi:hypothetical protein
MRSAYRTPPAVNLGTIVTLEGDWFRMKISRRLAYLLLHGMRQYPTNTKGQRTEE